MSQLNEVAFLVVRTDIEDALRKGVVLSTRYWTRYSTALKVILCVRSPVDGQTFMAAYADNAYYGTKTPHLLSANTDYFVAKFENVGFFYDQHSTANLVNAGFGRTTYATAGFNMLDLTKLAAKPNVVQPDTLSVTIPDSFELQSPATLTAQDQCRALLAEGVTIPRSYLYENALDFVHLIEVKYRGNTFLGLVSDFTATGTTINIDLREVIVTEESYSAEDKKQLAYSLSLHDYSDLPMFRDSVDNNPGEMFDAGFESFIASKQELKDLKAEEVSPYVPTHVNNTMVKSPVELTTEAEKTASLLESMSYDEVKEYIDTMTPALVLDVLDEYKIPENEDMVPFLAFAKEHHCLHALLMYVLFEEDYELPESLVLAGEDMVEQLQKALADRLFLKQESVKVAISINS